MKPLGRHHCNFPGKQNWSIVDKNSGKKLESWWVDTGWKGSGKLKQDIEIEIEEGIEEFDHQRKEDLEENKMIFKDRK